MSRPADILLRQGDTTPQWPTAGQISFYSKSNGVFYSLDSNGIETPLGGGAGTVTSVSIIANPSRLTATGNPITSSGSITLDLAETTVTAGAYTNANITVDAYGRITSASDGTAGGVASFNTRSGDITLQSGDVTTALGYTPYNVTNPAGYITGITGSDVTTALGFTPYNATNPSGYTSNTGTVTSVGSVGDNGVTVSGSPITGSGTITIGLGDITPLSVSATGSVTGLNLTGTNTGDETTSSIKTKLGITTLSGSNTGDQTITLTGDVTGSGTGSFSATLSDTGVTAATYGSATQVPVFAVDAKGRITSVSNATITGTGTVTSVTVSGGATGLSFSGTPITTSGTATMSGTLAIANGGTGQTTSSAAINALLPSQTGNTGKYLTTNGTTLSWGTVTAGAGTVTSVGGTGTVSGLTLSGSVTTSGNLTLGGALSLTSGNVTSALGFTPYNATNPSGYTSNTGTVTSVSATGSADITVGGSPITASGTLTFALANTAVTPGAYTNTNITVDAKGRITAISNGSAGAGTVTSVTVNGTAGRISSTGSPITSSGSITLDLATTAVTAATYGSATQVPVFSVDAYGRVTGVTNTAITAGGSNSPEIVVFHYSSGGSGTFNIGDAIFSQTSGVTATIIDAANCIATYSFTGKSNPPKSVTMYGQNFASNTFAVTSWPATGAPAANYKIAGGGTAASPDLANGIFSATNIVTMQTRMSDTGSAATIGNRAWLVVVFGF